MKLNPFSLFLLATLLAVSSARVTNKRDLKSKSGKGGGKNKELYADIESLIDGDDDDDELSEISGWVTIEYDDDDDMLIDYHITEGPERCDTCKLAIYDGKGCDDLKDPYYDTSENPWSVENTPYITNKKGRAAGFITTDNGYSSKDNKGKYVVLFDEDDDRRRMLSGRGLKGKGKAKKIACGELK